MKNLFIILAILVLPVFAYIVLDAGRDKNIISTAQALDKPSLIIFTSTMCSDCQKMKKVIAVVEPNYKDKIEFIKVNASDSSKPVQELVKKYNVYLVPTMIFVDKKGNQKFKKEGSMPKEDFEKQLKALING